MAQYHHLTVYKSAFDFLLKLTQATANFQKSYPQFAIPKLWITLWITPIDK